MMINLVLFNSDGSITGRVMLSDKSHLHLYPNSIQIADDWSILPIECLMKVDLKDKRLVPLSLAEAKIKGATKEQIEQAIKLGVIDRE